MRGWIRVFILALVAGAIVAMSEDARKVYYYDAFISDKVIMFDEDGMQKFCIVVKFDDNNHISRKELICKKWSRDVNLGFSDIGDDIIYKEVVWEWWWSQ
jgi:hypothetical protein